MNKTSVLTKIALVSALTGVVLILGSVFPSAALSLAALAGLFPAVLVKEHGFIPALAAYLIAGFLALLLSPVKYAAALFVLLFGFYQVIKQWMEKRMHRVVACICKFIFANSVFFFLYLCLTDVFAAVVPTMLKSFVLTWVLYLAAFLIYDFAGSEWLKFYEARIRR